MMATPSKKEEQPTDFYIQALLVAEVVKRILKKKANLELSNKPELTIKPIIEFNSRMRITGLDKFNEPAYISAINFYRSKEDLKKDNPIGALILYLGEEYIFDLVKALQYPDIEDYDEAVLADACGTLCNLIAGNFKAGLIQLNYEEIYMTHFSTYRNEVVEGVKFSYEQQELYEINFNIDYQKRIVVDLTLGSIPKKSGISI